MEHQCTEEVIQLHQFIEQWMSGQIEESERILARLEQALADDFVIVQPTGIKEAKAKVLANFRSAYGAIELPFAIDIRDLEVRLSTDTLCVVTYEEWHVGPEVKGRTSTAVFRRRAERSGVEWVHLHETMLPKAERLVR